MNNITYKNLFITILVILLSYCLLLINPSGGFAQDASDEKPPMEGREQTMSEQESSNIGVRFPEVNADSLAKTKVSIPDSATGKITLITVSFLRETQSQLDSWLNPFNEKFGDREDFTFYEIPMISGGYRLMRFVIDGGMRGGIPEEKHKNVVTFYGDIQKYINTLNLERELGYAFLLDREGIICWQEQGFSTQETLNEMFEIAEKLALK